VELDQQRERTKPPTPFPPQAKSQLRLDNRPDNSGRLSEPTEVEENLLLRTANTHTVQGQLGFLSRSRGVELDGAESGGTWDTRDPDLNPLVGLPQEGVADEHLVHERFHWHALKCLLACGTDRDGLGVKTYLNVLQLGLTGRFFFISWAIWSSISLRRLRNASGFVSGVRLAQKFPMTSS
jgi:hypothetical protein